MRRQIMSIMYNNNDYDYNDNQDDDNDDDDNDDDGYDGDDDDDDDDDDDVADDDDEEEEEEEEEDNDDECPSKRDVGFTESKRTALKKGKDHDQMPGLPRSLSYRELTVVVNICKIM